jgi:hypothetical protein
MHKTLTSVVALAGLAAAAGVAQAEPFTLIEEQADAVVAGDIEPIELSATQMDQVTAGRRFCGVCLNVAVLNQYAIAYAAAFGGFFGDTEAEASASNEAEIEQSNN